MRHKMVALLVIILSTPLLPHAFALQSENFNIDLAELNFGGGIIDSPTYQMRGTLDSSMAFKSQSSENYRLESGLVALEQMCGNGILELGEQCDDGNVNGGDGCSMLCQTETENGEVGLYGNQEGNEEGDGEGEDGESADDLDLPSPQQKEENHLQLNKNEYTTPCGESCKDEKSIFQLQPQPSSLPPFQPSVRLSFEEWPKKDSLTNNQVSFSNKGQNFTADLQSTGIFKEPKTLLEKEKSGSINTEISTVHEVLKCSNGTNCSVDKESQKLNNLQQKESTLSILYLLRIYLWGCLLLWIQLEINFPIAWMRIRLMIISLYIKIRQLR